MAQHSVSQSFPAVRLSESKDYVTVSAVVPGFAEGDLEIEPGRKDATAVGSDEDEQPLAEIQAAAAQEGLLVPPIRAMTRTGDTTSSQRA